MALGLITDAGNANTLSSAFVKVAPTVAFTRSASNTIRPSFVPDADNRYTVAANQTIDCRDRTVTQHGSGQSRFTPFVLVNCPGGVVVAGGETIGQQADSLFWRLMKSGPAPGAGGDTSWDDNGCDSISPTGSQTWENMRIEKAMDAINGYSEAGTSSITVRGCYIKKCRDDTIENDHLKPLLVEDCLVDSTHMFLSQRPDSASLATGDYENTDNITTIRNCLVRLRRQPYDVDSGGDTIPNGSKFDGPWNSVADPGTLISPSGTGAGYACAWLWKWHIGSGTNQHTLRVDCRDCVFVVESLGTSTTTNDGWPPGTYSNVTVIWLGPGAWPMGTPPGVTVLSGGSNISVWDRERDIWLRAHGCTDGTGDDFPFLRAAPSSATVTLPAWPTTYTGPTYYVSATSTVTSFTGNSRSSPCQATYALDNAASLSTIVFLGGSTAYAASGTSTLKLNRPTSVHLKLVSDVPAFTNLVNLRPTSMSLAQMDAVEDNCIVGKNLTGSARIRSFVIISGGNIWVEGFRMQYPDNWVVSSTIGGTTSTSTARTWFYLCYLDQGNQKNLQIGPQNNDNVNKLNVQHKCWIKSTNELGDSGFPAGGSGAVSDAGTAVTDYGITMHQNTGACMTLECGFQMRANHMWSTKRGVGLNTQATLNNRVEGCLFASWNRSYQRTSTILELGQECDEGTTEYTSWAHDIINNTFCDPNCRVLYIKNANGVNFTGNRVIRMGTFLFGTLDSGYTDRNTVQAGGVIPGPMYIGNNILMESAGNCDLYSTGAACEYTFENNATTNLIPLTTHATYRDPARIAQSSAPRPTVTRVGGNACGFAAATAG